MPQTEYSSYTSLCCRVNTLSRSHFRLGNSQRETAVAQKSRHSCPPLPVSLGRLAVVPQLYVAWDERGEGDDDNDHGDEEHDAGGNLPQRVAGGVPVRVGHP